VSFADIFAATALLVQCCSGEVPLFYVQPCPQGHLAAMLFGRGSVVFLT